MKTSLSLLSLIALSGATILACENKDPVVPVATGGGTGTGGIVGVGGVPPVGTGGGTPGTGGAGASPGTGGSGATAGTGGGPTSNALFDGVGTWIDGDANTVGIQGAFFILEDSVKNDVVVPPEEPVALTHTNFVAVTGGTDVDGFSKFDDTTEKPCISGSVAMVTDEMGMEDCDAGAAEDEAGACQWSAQWGGGIGLNLNETGEMEDGSASVKSPWNAQEHGVMGFTFTPSGDAGGATLRFKAKNPGSDEDFCAEFTIVPGVAVNIALSELLHKCWGTDGDQALDQTQLESLQWQIVSSDKMSYEVPSFCIENLSWY